MDEDFWIGYGPDGKGDVKGQQILSMIWNWNNNEQLSLMIRTKQSHFVCVHVSTFKLKSWE